MKTYNLCFILISASSLCLAGGEMTIYPESKYIFSDSFEDGSFDDDDEFFSWARSGVVNLSTVSLEEGNTDFKGQSYIRDGDGGDVVVVKENLKPLPIPAYGTIKPGRTQPTNEYAMDFKYNAGGRWSELRFDLGQPYKEIWIRYWLRVPTNFVHRDIGSAGTNNKLLAIFMDDYSQDGTGATVIWEYWRNGDEGSQLAWHYRDVYSGTNTGHAQRFDFINTSRDRGRWMQLVMHLKASSSNGVNDGVIETYRRWSNEGSFTRYHYSNTAKLSVPEDSNFAGWRLGYFMGYSNVSWNEETHWLIDGVEFSETPLLDITGTWVMNKPSKEDIDPTYIAE